MARFLASTAYVIIVSLLLMTYQNCTPYKAASDAALSGLASGPVTKVSAIMATGHMGRTLLSCDGGRTWVHDMSDDDSARCWVTGDPHYVECDHNALAGHLVDYDSGIFYADFGWGANGSLRTSTDAIHWTTIKSDGWGSGAIKIGTKMFLFWSPWSTSNDAGATWIALTNQPAIGDHLTIRKIGTSIVTTSTEGQFAVSNDVGQTWPTITQLAAAETAGGFAYGNGVYVALGNTAADGSGANTITASRSTDGGVTWSAPATVSSGYWLGWQGIVFNGTQFVAWGNGSRWTSSDGVTWSGVAMPLVPLTGPVIYHPATQSYVMVSSTWGSYYDAQKAYYSTDGITWVMLDTSHFKGGHPVNSIVIGEVDSTSCSN